MRKTKGFTLVELIVVMATFSIILFGALSLVDPIRTMFEKSYRNEEYTAAGTSISNYLESELQYAEYVQITGAAPTTATLRNFLNRRYDGKLTANSSGNAVYTSGHLYVLRIDNTNGGIISKWDLNYTMGDLDAIGVLKDNETVSNANAATFDTDPRYIYYTSDTEKGAKIEVGSLSSSDPTYGVYLTKLDAFDLAHPTIDSAINRAFYTEHHYNISLGNAFLNDDRKLQWNADYYNSFGTTPEEQKLKTFGQQNFGFTITSYSFDPVKNTVGRALTDGVNVYDDKTSLMTSSVSFSSKNMWDYKPYLQYKWDVNDAKTARTNEVTSEGTTTKQYEYYDLVDPTKSDATAKGHSVAFEITDDLMVADYSNAAELYSERLEPGVFYIVYTYCGEDILK